MGILKNSAQKGGVFYSIEIVSLCQTYGVVVVTAGESEGVGVIVAVAVGEGVAVVVGDGVVAVAVGDGVAVAVGDGESDGDGETVIGMSMTRSCFRYVFLATKVLLRRLPSTS